MFTNHYIINHFIFDKKQILVFCYIDFLDLNNKVPLCQGAEFRGVDLVGVKFTRC